MAGAFVCCAVAVGLTARVNIPLDTALEQSGPVDRIADPAAVRPAVERRWVGADVWRTVLTTASLALLARALFLHGQHG